jgi:hypothetical protein
MGFEVDELSIGTGGGIRALDVAGLAYDEEDCSPCNMHHCRKNTLSNVTWL